MILRIRSILLFIVFFAVLSLLSIQTGFKPSDTFPAIIPPVNPNPDDGTDTVDIVQTPLPDDVTPSPEQDDQTIQLILQKKKDWIEKNKDFPPPPRDCVHTIKRDYKKEPVIFHGFGNAECDIPCVGQASDEYSDVGGCLLYTSPSPRDA
eukprot:TRINITY_DN5238_c0_g1_i1.p1 TRINITY_DN5238_c0_g1~~TRINITY_DN5238_c0_g1_i1.p1  ORF type:complete len:150 (+),score=21.08 TRINITY_DN5238_c0_g1_i1:35-484(+)